MTARDSILQRLRGELSKGPPVELPPVAQVWPRGEPPTAAKVDRFCEELKAVHGEAFRAASIADARQALQKLAHEGQWTAVGVLDRPLCHELAGALEPSQVIHPCAQDGPHEMARLSAGLLAAECLLADTGSCVITCATPQERMLCYLPPACVVVARIEQLAEHLPAAWEKLAPRLAEPQARGEMVIVTGPSRTADIEKILILGVHGPKRLAVILVG